MTVNTNPRPNPIDGALIRQTTIDALEGIVPRQDIDNLLEHLPRTEHALRLKATKLGASTPDAINGELTIGSVFVYTDLKVAAGGYRFEHSAWGLGLGAFKGWGLLYTAYESWEAFFSETRGFHCQGTGVAGGFVQVNWFNGGGVPVGQLNTGAAGFGAFEMGGSGRWEK